MARLNRPNAPNRLPSADFGDLFIKSHVSFSPETITANTPSPSASPTTTARRRINRSSEPSNARTPSPLSSPKQPTTAGRSRYRDRRNYFSDPSDTQALKPEEAVTPTPLNHITPKEVQERRCSEERKSTRGSAASSNSSALSTISARARKLLNVPPVRIDGQPPREARSGFNWKYEGPGHWFELRIGRNRRSEYPSPIQEDATPRQSSHATAATQSPGARPFSSAGTAVEHRQLLSRTTSSSEGLSESSTPQEGLYCRTKRVLGLKRGLVNTPIIEPSGRSVTGDVLGQVASTLRGLPERRSTPSSSATSVSNSSIAADRWHRFRSNYRHRYHSSSSSIGGIQMGKSPMTTPAPEAMYTGSDSHQYLAVELSEPDGPTYLPSEARRIHTPPLPTGSSGGRGLRGFFFDYSAALKDSADEGSLEIEEPRQEPRKRATRTVETDWYRVKLDAIDMEGTSPEQFVSSVPEHLPNSPLCPRHPRHKSGGRGKCIYHGRNESFRQDLTPRPTQGNSSMLEE